MGKQSRVEGIAGKSSELVRTRPENTWGGDRGVGLLREEEGQGEMLPELSLEGQPLH